jgi:hypothetical protein
MATRPLQFAKAGSAVKLQQQEKRTTRQMYSEAVLSLAAICRRRLNIVGQFFFATCAGSVATAQTCVSAAAAKAWPATRIRRSYIAARANLALYKYSQ